MAGFLFYEQPIALNREAHAGLKLDAEKLDYGFARNVTSAPVAGAEFQEAAARFPIVFAGDDEGGLFPVALFGLRQAENRFVDAKGRWLADYVPAFLRRYPFILADQQAIAFDEACPALNYETGEPVLDAEGNDAEALERISTFLVSVDREIEATRQFCQTLRELNLLKDWTLQVVSDSGMPVTVEGFQVVDRQALGRLTDDQVVRLFRESAMAWIDAHLVSLGRLQALAGASETPSTAAAA